MKHVYFSGASCSLIVQLLPEAKGLRERQRREQSESGPGADRSFHVNTLSHSTLAPPPFIVASLRARLFRLLGLRVFHRRA